MYNNDMLEHHIQREIVYRLAFAKSLRFSELKPDHLENKSFDYHLKIAIRDGLIAKNENGEYELTSEGKRVGKGALKNSSRFLDRAYSVLFLAIKSGDSYLLYRRKTQPMLGGVGFMHAQPNIDETICETAKRVLTEQTGLSGDFAVKSSGFFRIFRGDEIESFTHFTLLFCENAAGELNANDNLAEYFWMENPDFSHSEMLPSMPTLAKILADTDEYFVEQTLRI